MMSSSLGTMGSLLGKLHTQLVSPEHHQLPKSLKDGMEHLKQDLEELNSLLVDLSRLGGPNAMVERWMNEVRELSYDMEDYIDSTTMRPNTMASRKMNKEILSVVKQFRNLAKQARERHRRYELQRWASSSPISMADGQLPSVNWKATELVGIDASKGELIKWLKPLSNIEEAGRRLKVVSILGPAGVGKSTLAQEVYREIRAQFERRAFVRASRVPDARRLLRSMIYQVRRHQRPPCGLPVQELVNNLRTHLEQKRYFIVIDGLWETTSWDIIRNAFPEGPHCSTVLITTEIEEVALECCNYQSHASVTWAPESMLDPGFHFDAQVGIFKMEPLSTDDSMELFFNRVFGSKPEFSEQLKKCSGEIIGKCSGLPLATIIIASVFACQPENSEIWHHVKEYLSSRNNLSPGDMLKEIIVLRYYSLSQQLKTCLLYLNLFPEGNTFLKTDLVKQWTAEGFISAVASKGANEVAECYLDELVSMGLVQANHINLADEVIFYTVHSTVFEVMRRISIEENFITVIDYSETIPKPSAKVRRLSLSFSNAKYATKPEGFTLSSVRSLNFYGLVECLPSIMDFKLLRVLILEFWGDREMYDLSGICILLHLRYFRITTDSIIKLPVKMQGLKYLETLEIYASVVTVPSDIVHLPKLLHLHLHRDIELPNYVGQLRSLRTLQYFDLSCNTEDNVRSLGELTNLHELHMTCSTALSGHLERNLIALASSIGKHGNLKSLTLAPGVSCTGIYTDCSLVLSSPHVVLEKLKLLPPICIFSRLPEWIGQLQNLCILKIVVRELRREDVNRLSGLMKLTVLSLYVRQPTAQRIIFNSAAFPVLKYVKFRCAVLRLSFQAEAIPNLRRLKVEFNAHRGEQHGDVLAGIEHLLNLQEIAVRIGAAPGAEESDKMAAESVLKDTIGKHTRQLSFNVRRANSFEEEIPQFSDPAPSLSHSDELLNRSTMIDVTGQPNEIDEIQEVSLGCEYRGANDPVKQTDQHQGAFKFGNWEDEGAHLYTMYSENARKGKSAGMSSSQNYQKGDPEALSKDTPSAKAFPVRTGSDPMVQKSNDEANREEILRQQQGRVVNVGVVPSPALERRGSSEGNRGTAPTRPRRFSRRSSDYGYDKPERGRPIPKFGEWDSNPTDEEDCHYSSIFTKVREEKTSGPILTNVSGYNSSNQARVETPERGSAVPKFGEWDDTSASGSFSDIFNRVREEKKTSNAPAVITGDAGYNRSNQGSKSKLGCSCLGCFRNDYYK